MSYYSFRNKLKALRFCREQYALGNGVFMIALNATQYRVRVTYGS